MKNRFFKIALAQAARLAGKPGRMLHLTGQVMHRLYHMDSKQISLNALRQQLNTLGRLTMAYASGRYRNIPIKPFLTILAALLYFLNPLDLIPDAILGVGLMDDLAVLTWVYRSASEELDKFIAWDTLVRQASTVQPDILR